MSLIQIFLSVFNFKIKCAFLAIVAYRRCNLKSHASFALSFSNTIPLSHRFSYQMASWPTNFCCFAQATARIICARLCLVRYSPSASLMFPATTCSTVSEYWIHFLQLPSSASTLASFHDLVSIVCSNIVLIAAVFPGQGIWDNHTWHSCSCPLYNLLG